MVTKPAAGFLQLQEPAAGRGSQGTENYCWLVLAEALARTGVAGVAGCKAGLVEL